MATGLTNSKQGDVKIPSASPLCMFRCTVNSSGTRANTSASYQSDYFSYDSDTLTFTARKAFSGTLVLFGRGARNQNGTAQAVTYRFYKNGSQLYTGTIGASADTLPSDQSISIAYGDTVAIQGTAGDANMPMIGFMIQLA